MREPLKATVGISTPVRCKPVQLRMEDIIMMRKPITWILAPVLIFGLVPQMSCSMFAGGGQRFVEGNLYKDNKVDFKARRMGILDFQSYTPERTDGRYAADMITIELLFSGFNVLERRYIKEVLQELQLQVSGLTDEKALVEIGKILGVDLLMVGAVTFYGYDIIKGISNVGISARIIEVESGKVVWAMGATKRSSSLQESMYNVSLALTESLGVDKIYIWE